MTALVTNERARRKYAKTDQALSRLTSEQYRVTQKDGTEAPFSGEYVDNEATGSTSTWSQENHCLPRSTSTTLVPAGQALPARWWRRMLSSESTTATACAG